MTEVARRLGSLGAEVSQQIGGTASGEDRAMLDLTQQAAARAQQAAQSYAQAAQAARRAAAEAAQREAARKSKGKAK